MAVSLWFPIFVVSMLSLLEAKAYRIPRYPAGDGTTPNIIDILDGRCNEYIQCIPPINSNIECDAAQGYSFNCTELVMDFLKDIAYTEPCTLGPNAFDDFVAKAAQDFPANSHLLWSGTKDIAHDYGLFTGRKTLEDSLIGFMMNDIAFCGSTQPPGLNFVKCPSCESYKESASGIFWPKASGTFASLAKGHVQVVLSAFNFGRPSFRNGSIFRDIEVPRLTSDVTKLTAILVKDIGENSTKLERCGAGSLLELKTIIESKNIDFECVENPNQIKALQCAAKPRAKECRDFFQPDDEECFKTGLIVAVIILVISLVIVLLSVLIYYVMIHRKSKTENYKTFVCDRTTEHRASQNFDDKQTSLQMESIGSEAVCQGRT